MEHLIIDHFVEPTTSGSSNIKILRSAATFLMDVGTQLNMYFIPSPCDGTA
jgi:hypothetical protein